ncbi:MAG: YhgE/Pip domain-containing protein [Vulcanibacillus sp.]
MLRNKMLLILPIIVLVVIFVFALTLIPAVNPTPKNLPIAIVNEDPVMGKMIVDNIRLMSSPTTGEEPAVQWIEVESYEAVQAGLDNQEYYAALVIPSDYSAKQASLLTSDPTSPEIEIIINQGMNAMAANVASQMLNGIVDNINNGIRAQLVEGFDKQGGVLTTKQATALVSPITKKITNVNEIGTHSANGNSPVILFQPIWMASIIGAAALFSMRKEYIFSNKREKFFTLLVETFVGIVLALIVGFGLTWISSSLLGLNIPRFTDTALFLSVTYLCFFLMILATISWLGLKGGLSIYLIIMFFGAPLLSMPPEFVSSFYQDWIYTWLPIMCMVDGLRELFFFGTGLSWNHPTYALVGIGFASLLILYASIYKPASRQKLKF